MNPSNFDWVRGAKAGGASAGILVFATMSLAGVVFATQDPQIAGVLPIIILSAVVLAFLASAIGSIAGALGSRTGNPILGAFVGSLVFLLAACVYVSVFVSPVEPRAQAVDAVILSLILGYVSGCVGTIYGCPTTERTATILSRFWKRSLLFIPPFILVVIWTALKINDGRHREELYSSGCEITWNALGNHEPRWEIRFRDSKINDEAFKRIVGSLARYSPVDLDLSNSQITDKGIVHVKMIRSLIRLQLENTSVSNDTVADLSKQLPHVTITK